MAPRCSGRRRSTRPTAATSDVHFRGIGAAEPYAPRGGLAGRVPHRRRRCLCRRAVRRSAAQCDDTSLGPAASAPSLLNGSAVPVFPEGSRADEPVAEADILPLFLAARKVAHWHLDDAQAARENLGGDR